MTHHDVRFPNESDAYRAARNELLDAEIELRRKVEEVAQKRRALPPGGEDTRVHTYNSELLFAKPDPGLDYTPEGRGTDWYPSLTY